MHLKILLGTIFILLSFNKLHAQKDFSRMKFGEVKPADFDLSGVQFDSSADAVILHKSGHVMVIENNEKIFKETKRIKILSENGKKVANTSIPIYMGQKIEYFKGCSYKLKDGKVVKTKMTKEDYRFDNETEYKSVIKYTIPNTEVGTIIDIEYEYKSPYSFMPDWDFQDNYPVLYSIFELQELYIQHFLALEQTHKAFDVRKKTKKDVSASRIWALKNLPAKKIEPLVYSPEAYYAKIQFETLGREEFADWDKFSKYVMNYASWYRSFYKKSELFENLIPEVKDESKLEKAKRIYYYFRDNYTTKKTNRLRPKDRPAVLFKSKKGTRTEINLMLMSCLRSMNYNANAVMINTRSNGKPITNIPFFKRLNYVVCHLELDGVDYFLDAADRSLQFDKLPLFAYNGHAHIVDKNHKVYNLSADSVIETRQTVLKYNLNLENDVWECSDETNYGFYTSQAIKINQKKEDKDKFEDQFKKGFTEEIDLKKLEVSNSETDTFCAKVSMNYELESTGSFDKIYAKLGLEKPDEFEAFKPDKRDMPIEFQFAKYYFKTTELSIPKGYKVESIPKSSEIELINNKGSYVLLAEESKEKVTIVTILRMNKAIFSQHEFIELKKFYNYIEALQEESIVLSKIKK